MNNETGKGSEEYSKLCPIVTCLLDFVGPEPTLSISKIPREIFDAQWLRLEHQQQWLRKEHKQQWTSYHGGMLAYAF